MIALADRLLSASDDGPFQQLKGSLIRAHSCLSNMSQSGLVIDYALAREQLVLMRRQLDAILKEDMPPSHKVFSGKDLTEARNVTRKANVNNRVRG